jgi:hypothetical protein
MKYEKTKPEEFFVVPSGVGLHISIGKHKVGDKIDFVIERLIGYDNHKLGQVSRWDSSKLISRTIALKVAFLGNAKIEQINSTHIAIAAVGFSK